LGHWTLEFGYWDLGFWVYDGSIELLQSCWVIINFAVCLKSRDQWLQNGYSRDQKKNPDHQLPKLFFWDPG
jgi:hypothetical protein